MRPLSSCLNRVYLNVMHLLAVPGLRCPDDDGVVVVVVVVFAAGCFVAGAAVVLGLVPFIIIYIFKYYNMRSLLMS